MLLELGPVALSDVASWTRVARRMVSELRLDPADLGGIATPDFLEAWSSVIDQIDTRCSTCDVEFRSTDIVDDDVAEYLVHGMSKCLSAPSLGQLITDQERHTHLKFTGHLAEALVTGLVEEGRDCEHYLDRIRTALETATQQSTR